MIKRLSHLGIAAKDIQESSKLYEQGFGLKVEHVEEVASQKVKTAFLPVGELNIELLEPIGNEGPIAKFLESNPRGGIHHVCFEVEDIESALDALKAAGVPLVDQEPRPGAHGAMVAFLHPKGTGGVLIELAQYPKGHG